MTNNEIHYALRITKSDILQIIKDHYRHEDFVTLVMEVVDDGFGEVELAKNLIRLLTEYHNEVTK